jgi:hypothetical protein
MFTEGLKMKGRLTVAINGEVVRDIPNLVVTTGKNFVASRIKDATVDAMSHMAIGTGSAAPAAGDTALGSELHRNALESTAVSNNIVTYQATFAAGEGVGAVTEAGLFNAAAAGTMFCRTGFAVVNKGASDSMTITWSVTVS